MSIKLDVKTFLRYVDNEMAFLRYYGTSDSRDKLTINSDIYKDVKIGWSKRPLGIRQRCGALFLKSNTEINNSTRFCDLETTHDTPESSTPLEVFIKIYPERKQDIIDILTSKESNPDTSLDLTNRQKIHLISIGTTEEFLKRLSLRKQKRGKTI